MPFLYNPANLAHQQILKELYVKKCSKNVNDRYKISGCRYEPKYAEQQPVNSPAPKPAPNPAPKPAPNPQVNPSKKTDKNDINLNGSFPARQS